MDLKKLCPNKLAAAEEVTAVLKIGSRIFIGSGCGEPQHLIRPMVDNQRIEDIMIYQMFAFTLSNYINDKDFLRRFSLKLFFISSLMRKAAYEGKVDYIPAYLSEIPHLFNINQIGLDVALVQISPPDRFGFGILGVSVDVTKPAMLNADLVIAQVNPKMPCTWGDSFVHIDEIDFLVLYEEPLVESLLAAPDETVTERIGFYISELIDDGDTLQVGFGNLPYFILQHLEQKKDLGIHTQMITDAFKVLSHL